MKDVFKEADISPKKMLAGDSYEITIRLVVGPAGTAENSRIIVDCPAYLGYDRPTRLDQESGGYIALFCSNPDVGYTERVWDMEIEDFPTLSRTSFKGMAARMMTLDLRGALEEDDELVIKWGWMRNGHAVGTKVCTVVPARDFTNYAHVRYFADPDAGLPDFARSFKGYDRPEPDQEIELAYQVRPRDVERLRLYRGHTKASLVPFDRFYNVGEVGAAAELVHLPEEAEVEQNAHGVFEFADPHIEVTSRGLPMEEAPPRDDVFDGYNIYFGDVHTHSQYSIDCIEREKLLRPPDDLHAYAREVACIDFHGCADHHQCWDEERHKIGVDHWQKTLEAARKHNKPGEYVAFTGIEYRCARGDTAVVFGEEFDYELLDNPEIKRIDRLWEAFEGRDFITIPHFHMKSKLPEGEWLCANSLQVEPVLEIYSCHGSYERPEGSERHISEIKDSRPDRWGTYLLKNGYRYGFVCNSDGHKGVVGNNGLTAVYAKTLDRASILEALRARRCYGTTSAHIRLLFTINGALMGSELPAADEKKIVIDVAGTVPLKAVDLCKDGDVHKRFKPYADAFRIELTEECADPSNWYVRAVQMDNSIAYSSPIWVG